jgi:hypothetical protein
MWSLSKSGWEAEVRKATPSTTLPAKHSFHNSAHGQRSHSPQSSNRGPIRIHAKKTLRRSTSMQITLNRCSRNAVESTGETWTLHTFAFDTRSIQTQWGLLNMWQTISQNTLRRLVLILTQRTILQSKNCAYPPGTLTCASLSHQKNSSFLDTQDSSKGEGFFSCTVTPPFFVLCKFLSQLRGPLVPSHRREP